MKRFAFLVALALLIGGIPFAMNAGRTDHKTEICHFDDEGVGHVINVSNNALPHHISKHGDCEDFVLNKDGTCSCGNDDGDGGGDGDGDGDGGGGGDVDMDGDNFTPNQGDCNDNDSSINPGALEIVGDGIDNDCDGLVDEAP